MATYVIGDVHGCYDELQLLLNKIAFNKQTDLLWFTGDLVVGGNKSLETLQFIKSLGDRVICVLGNHDLTLLGLIMGNIDFHNKKYQEFEALLMAANKNQDLIAWLQSLPLLHYDKATNTLLVHAGIAPQWDTEKALMLAKEVEDIIQSKQAPDFFANMLGNEPTTWHDNLASWERLRCITNYFTRLRFCTKDGTMNLLAKGPSHTAPLDMMPWYAVPDRLTRNTRIIFGHWAALVGETKNNNVIALDTGCMWGNYLSALRLEDNCMFQIKSFTSYE